MRTTTVAVANAIIAGIKSNFSEDKQDQLEKLEELLLDLAASLEFEVDMTEKSEAEANRLDRYSSILGSIAMRLGETDHRRNYRRASEGGEVL